MEKKRKLPARASARVEQASKKRHVRERSPSPPPPPPVREDSPPPQQQPELPSSIQVGKPLPTVEDPQPDLPLAEYQSVSESGVLAESLSRSRQRWTSDGLFEKFWSKPHKRKGVLHEDPGNPPKDSMTRVGTVTLVIEPHIVEATMYTVRAPKPLEPVQQPQPQPAVQPPAPGRQQQQQQHPPSSLSPARPVLQYGPPSGAMPPPPPPTPTPAAATPVSAAPNPQPVASPSPVTDLSRRSLSPGPRFKSEAVFSVEPCASASPATVIANATPAAANPGPATTTTYTATSPVTPVAATPPMVTNQQQPKPPRQAAAPPPVSSTKHAAPAPPAPAQAANRPTAGPPSTVAISTAPRPAANDPVIALLAQKASGDSELRDLMKRVAVGQAKEGELAQFQKVIDQLNAECKQRSGPAADRLLVDGRTVKYFADEVRTILDIVLTSNPNQKSAELKPPPRSDPLVVLLVKTALEDQRTNSMIRRIAESRPALTDAQDLKEILDRLHRDAKTVPKGQPPTPAPPRPKQPPAANGTANGHVKAANTSSSQAVNSQALRCKGPPSAAASRPDITAVVFDFGNGDRYLFPKYSILEYLPTQSGQQVIASFLIVRKGSSSEYGGDPALDYYQPVTIRLSTTNGRHLENLARVVAPLDQVRRYMDDVMDNMTRAEYVLLAMRLPRAELDPDRGLFAAADEPKTSCSTPKSDPELDKSQPTRSGVLWASAPTKKPLELSEPIRFRDPEQQSQLKYERLIRSIAERDTDAAP